MLFYINVDHLHHHYMDHEWELIVQKNVPYVVFVPTRYQTFEKGLQLYASHVEVITLL